MRARGESAVRTFVTRATADGPFRAAHHDAARRLDSASLILSRLRSFSVDRCVGHEERRAQVGRDRHEGDRGWSMIDAPNATATAITAWATKPRIGVEVRGDPRRTFARSPQRGTGAPHEPGSRGSQSDASD
jgi:hypothetical protein